MGDWARGKGGVGAVVEVRVRRLAGGERVGCGSRRSGEFGLFAEEVGTAGGGVLVDIR